MRYRAVLIRNIVFGATFASMACVVPVTLKGESIQLSFDTLFPDSPYEKVLNMCMQLYGELDALCEARDSTNISAANRTFISDSMLGKAMRLQRAVNNLLSGDHAILLDNIEYLVQLLERMELRSSDLQGDDDAYEVILSNMLGAVRAKLEAVLE